MVFAFFAIYVHYKGGNFCSARNLETLLRQSCVYATAGTGMTMIIIAAGIDLSAGSLIALSLVTVAYVMNIKCREQTGNRWLMPHCIPR